MNVNQFIRQVLSGPIAAASLVDHEGTPVGAIALTTKLPPNYLERLPLVYARHTTGSEHNADLSTDYASITVDVYAPNEYVAEKIASLVRKALHGAWRKQTSYALGHISHYQCLLTPFLFPRTDQADDSDRYTAEYRLLIRPAD